MNPFTFTSYPYIIISYILCFIIGCIIGSIPKSPNFLEVDYINHMGIAVVHNTLTDQVACYRDDHQLGYIEVECPGNVPKKN